MRYRALACDYDGTVATHGRVDEDTLASLRQWIDAGRKLLLVTGRELPELKTVFPELDLFHYVVAENGGLLYVPATGEEQPVAAAPPPEFVQELIDRGVGPISVGRSIVATWQPHENAVLDTIKRQGLELQVIFNKGAVMILPSGVNKATGLAAALRALELSRHSVVAVGDAENDHAFLNYCRCGVAVANALPSLKQRAEIVTRGDHGRGVQELIGRLLANDLADIESDLLRHAIPLGGDPARHWFPGDEHLAITGDAKRTESAAHDLARQLTTAGYQYCRFACDALPSSPVVPVTTPAPTEATLGTADALPTPDEVIQQLARPDQSVRVVLCAHGPDDRRQRLGEIWLRLQAFVRDHGRPHVVFLPTAAELKVLGLKADDLLRELPSTILIKPEQPASPPSDDSVLTLDANLWQSSPTVISAP